MWQLDDNALVQNSSPTPFNFSNFVLVIKQTYRFKMTSKIQFLVYYARYMFLRRTVNTNEQKALGYNFGVRITRGYKIINTVS